MSRANQRKGRRNELELAKLLQRCGFEVRVHGQYEPLDLTVEGVPAEVKTRKGGFGLLYQAVDAGAGLFFAKADRKPWLMLTISVLDNSIQSPADLFGDGRSDKKHDSEA